MNDCMLRLSKGACISSIQKLFSSSSGLRFLTPLPLQLIRIRTLVFIG